MEDLLDLTSKLSLNSDQNQGELDQETVEKRDAKRKLELKDELETVLRGYEDMNKWKQEMTDSKVGFSIEGAKLVYGIMTAKFLELENAEGSDEAEIKYSATELLGRKMVLLYLSLHLEKFDKFPLLLKDIEDLIQDWCLKNKYVPVEYNEGFQYTLRGLRALRLLANVEGDEEPDLKLRQQLLQEIKSSPFKTLSNKGKVGVKVAHHSFLGQFQRHGYQDSLDLLVEMNKLDPDNYEWYYHLYNIRRYKRRDEQVGFLRAPPSIEEQQAICKAVSLAPKHAHILVSFCCCLAEIIRDTPHINFPMRFGTNNFNAIGQITDFIYAQLRGTLDLDPMSVRVNITVAEICMSVLPPWNRDMRLAKLCIERALLFHPNSSKANHRMAIYLLTVASKPLEAEKFLESALEADKRSFPALIEYIQTCMACPIKNDEKLTQLFDRELNNLEWDTGKLTNITVMKGLHFMMKGDFEPACASWIESYKKDKDTVKYFQKFGYWKKRYGWNDGNLSLDSVIQILLNSKFYQSERRQIDELIAGLQRESFEGAGAHRGRGGGGSRGRGGDRGGFRVGFRGGDRGGGDRGGGFRGGSRGGNRGFGGSGFRGRGNEYSGSGDHGQQERKPPVVIQSSYEILGVSKDTPKSEVKAAYHKLCLQTHPDKHPNAKEKEYEILLEKIKKINVAYEDLCG